MTRLPSLKPRQIIAALERAGFVVVRVKGSHYQLQNPSNGRRATVPFHGGDISRATLGSIISQSGLTADTFLDLL
jgi:predicted RNA binding protein YcfA (HicA-like mRNA interferase family)